MGDFVNQVVTAGFERVRALNSKVDSFDLSTCSKVRRFAAVGIVERMFHVELKPDRDIRLTDFERQNRRSQYPPLVDWPAPGQKSQGLVRLACFLVKEHVHDLAADLPAVYRDRWYSEPAPEVDTLAEINFCGLQDGLQLANQIVEVILWQGDFSSVRMPALLPVSSHAYV